MTQKTGTAAAGNQGRRHVEGKPNLPVFAGALSHELESHALLRAQGFFNYIVTMKIVVAAINELGKASKKQYRHSAFVMVKATDQIGSGMRSDDTAVYNGFDTRDADVVKLPTTHFQNADAAHLCNLGLSLDMPEACKGSDFTRGGYEYLKVYAGATKLLPQQVNIGVDRKIDLLHADLGKRILDDDGLVFTRDRVATYREEAIATVTTYRDAKRAAGSLGLAACADCYLAAYADTDFDGRVFRRVYPEIIGLCEGSPFFRGASHLFYR